MTLWDLLRSPDGYAGQPNLFLTNQLGHMALVGALPALIVPVWLIALVYAVWELVQIFRFDGDVWDSAEDLGFVLAAALSVAMLSPVPALLGALFLMAGYLKRRDEQ